MDFLNNGSCFILSYFVTFGPGCKPINIMYYRRCGGELCWRYLPGPSQICMCPTIFLYSSCHMEVDPCETGSWGSYPPSPCPTPWNSSGTSLNPAGSTSKDGWHQMASIQPIHPGDFKAGDAVSQVQTYQVHLGTLAASKYFFLPHFLCALEGMLTHWPCRQTNLFIRTIPLRYVNRR